MNIKIMLNDEKSIAELAKDPEVVKVIKTAIIDGVSKRVAKTMEGEITCAIEKEIRSFTKPNKANEVFDKTSYYETPLLSSKMKKHIDEVVAMKVRNEIGKIIDEFSANAEYVEAFNRRKKEIEAYDFDKAVEKFITSRLANSFGKLMMR